MTEKMPPNHKKIIPVEYDVGLGNYFQTIPYPSKGERALWGYGTIEGKFVQMEGQNIEEIKTKLLNYVTEAKRDYAIKLSKCDVLELTLKENGLVKIVKDSGEKK